MPAKSSRVSKTKSTSLVSKTKSTSLQTTTKHLANILPKLSKEKVNPFLPTTNANNFPTSNLSPQIIKTIKIKLLVRRSIKVGDKICGRHGNKGVVSKIVPTEDMPYLADGTPIDIILNPLSVPSRMNIGQILEVNVGLISYKLGLQFKHLLNVYERHPNNKDVLIFISNKISEFYPNKNISTTQTMLALLQDLSKGVKISSTLFSTNFDQQYSIYSKRAALPDSTGQLQLFDGKTGKPYANKVTVGIIYICKLNHMVDDKIHARSTGPYSIIHQQPLKGRRNRGGQRVGEMEV